jgi:hypothetical protein
LHSWWKCAFASTTLQAGWQPSNSKSSRDEARDSHTLQDELAHMFKVPATSPSTKSTSLFLFLFDTWENINEQHISAAQLTALSCFGLHMNFMLKQTVRNSACAWPFLEPVDPSEVTDYYDFIKDPIGL